MIALLFLLFRIVTSIRNINGIFDQSNSIICPLSSTLPYSAIGQIDIEDITGNFTCTGTLIGPDVVLTAAHCVYKRASSTFFNKFTFSPGRYNNGLVINPYGKIDSLFITTYREYTDPNIIDPNIWDLAIIKLTKQIGFESGWMGLYNSNECSDKKEFKYFVAGYPNTQLFGTCVSSYCYASIENNCSQNYLYHKCSTSSGDSGAPMWRKNYYIEAIHNLAWLNEYNIIVTNSAVLITPKHYKTILSWINASSINYFIPH